MMYTNETDKLEAPAAIKPALEESFKDGEESKVTVPMMLSLGASYMATEQFRGELGLTYYMNSSVDWDNTPDSLLPYLEENEKYKQEDYYDNGWEIGIAGEYTITPELLKASIGFLHTYNGGQEKAQEDLGFHIGSNSLCLGGVYTAKPELDLTLGYMFTKYTEGEKTLYADSVAETGKYGNQTYNNTSHVIAIGVNYNYAK